MKPRTWLAVMAVVLAPSIALAADPIVVSVCEIRLELPGGHRLLATLRGHVPPSPDESVTVRVAPDAFLDVS
jgi:hypothetical protein